jgi:hypothetical protein
VFIIAKRSKPGYWGTSPVVRLPEGHELKHLRTQGFGSFLLWEGACIEASALCRHNGKAFMFYAGAYNN